MIIGPEWGGPFEVREIMLLDSYFELMKVHTRNIAVLFSLKDGWRIAIRSPDCPEGSCNNAVQDLHQVVEAHGYRVELGL